MSGSGPRSPLSAGIEWSARITALGFEFAVPPVLGYLIDRRVGSTPIGILVGMVIGFLVGMTHILRIARDGSKPT